MGKKLKSLSLSKLKTTEAEIAEGKTERRVVFVASTSTLDRDREHVDIETFRLPLKGGGEVLVSDLPPEGIDNVDVPLLTDHDLWSVEKTIGSVRRAMFADGELIFEAGISSRPYAQDVFKLVEEGHLDNAFSIQFDDYDFNSDSRTNSNGEIIEVSLVTRGSNKDAQVLAVKQAKGKTMENDNPEAPKEEIQKSEAPVAEQDSHATPAEDKDTTPEVGEDSGNKQEDNAAPTEGAEKEEENMSGDLNHKEMAAKQVKLPSQADTSSKTTNSYLKSKAAVLDYAKVAKKCLGDATSTNEAWKEHLAQKGITVAGEDGFLPTRVEQVMFKAWHDAVGALKTFRRTSAKSFKFYAMTTDSRAQGHKRGEQKIDQDIVAIPRNGGLKVVYKKLPIDWIDIVNDESGELYIFRTRELTDRVLAEIVRGSILGDGRTAPASGQPDYRVFDGVNGLYPIVGDLDAADTADSFASTVATVIPNASGDDTRAKIVKTLGAVRVNDGERKVLVLAEGTLGDMLLEKNSVGGYMYSMDTDFTKVFNVSYIVEFPAELMAAAGYDVIAYKDQGYTLGGPDATVRNWFDGNVNQDVMLVEQPVLGSLEGYKVAAGYKAAAAPARASKTASKTEDEATTK